MPTTLLSGLLGCAVLAVVLLALEVVRWAWAAARRAARRQAAVMPADEKPEESLR
jgi:cell division septation protein DedD